jgi:hypothetical protein
MSRATRLATLVLIEAELAACDDMPEEDYAAAQELLRELEETSETEEER